MISFRSVLLKSPAKSSKYSFLIVFQNPDDDGEVYLNLSHVECDLNPEDVSRLVEFGIAEVHPTDPDKLRLIDFTQ